MGKTVRVTGFPGHVTAEEVKDFLELRLGKGAVYAIKIRQPRNGGQRKFAIIQFTTIQAVELIFSLTQQRLMYGVSYLKAWTVEHDIVPKPRTFLHTIEHLTLHFGCQISKIKFSVLWKVRDVLVNFGFSMRKIQILLSHHQEEYKLDLSYENIWQIELHHLGCGSVKYLVIQLYGAPRIFKKDVRPSCMLNMYESPAFNYFKEVPDEQWARTTDFTPSSPIGHSTALCLELPSDLELPNFQDHFAFYKETRGNFVLERGSAYSSNLDLVPIVGPSSGVDLPYEILFRVNLLVQNGCLAGSELDAGFYKLVDPSRIDIVYIEHALEKLLHLKECCYEPPKWLHNQYLSYLLAMQPLRSPSISIDSGLVYVRRIQITPCKVYFSGPEINVSNRVLRHYSEYVDDFLRVSFVDEELDKVRSTDLAPRASFGDEDRRTAIYKRIFSTLRNGIVIGHKRFEFLAFSSSQLRENSCWMFASSNGLTAASIRKWMGDFHQIRNVAKYAARLGQSFSSSTETLSVRRDEIEIIPDVEVGKYVFSDGIGKISAEFAKKVALKCGCTDFFPSAFQIRYSGYKGVVATDPTSFKKLSLRKSMCKYESENIKLDVLGYSKYQPGFLNRQLITLLSTLGVPDHAFEKRQKEAVDQLDAMLTDPLSAQEALELMYPGETTNILKEMLLCGYMPDTEPFLSMMLQTFRASKLLDLRTKTRIFLPKARSMMGCLDETRTLEYGQVFIQYSGARSRHLYDTSFNRSGQRFVIQGQVVVAKNPCLHPGDIRILRAVNVPALHHMVDCVVFPQKGPRPHPNECSGSDLDGDIYFVCWDQELIPLRQMEPMDYTPEPTVQLDHDVTIEEVEEYFTNYIVNDSLGIIANAHIVFADKEHLKAMSSPCLELARKFSIAVDFPKTGVPAELSPDLYVKEYPDFMEKLDKPTYESRNVIGKLFREVRDIAPLTSSIKSFTLEVANQCYDRDMEVEGFENYIDDAVYYKGNYDFKLGNHLDYYGIRSEAEILSGNIMKMSKSFTKKRDAEAIGMAVRALRKEARSWFNEKGSGLDSEDDDVFAKASAWYHVTYHPSYWGSYNEGLKRDHFLSFPWCVYDKLILIKKRKVNSRRFLGLSSLDNHFGGLHLG